MITNKTVFDQPLIATQELLPMMLTNVNKGNLSLHDLIKVTSENPAKIFGLYPIKGAIQVGSDADLTILGMEKEQRFTKEMVQSKSGWTFWWRYIQGMACSNHCQRKNGDERW